MVNIDHSSQSPAILREILQNREIVSHDTVPAKVRMQENAKTLTNDSSLSSHELNGDHMTRSDRGSETGSDEESSFLDQSRVDETEVDDSKSDADETQSNDCTSVDDRDVKRARAENIMTAPPHPSPYDIEAMYGLADGRRKRKQSLPQQLEQAAKLRRLEGHPYEEDLWGLRHQLSAVQNYFRHYEDVIPKPMNGYMGMENIHRLHQAYFANISAARHAEEMQKEQQQQQNAQAKAAILGAFEKRMGSEHDRYNIAEHVRETVNANKGLSQGVAELNPKELNELICCLKSKIEDAVSATVDSELSKFFSHRNKQKEHEKDLNKDQNKNGEYRSSEHEKRTTDHSLNHILQMPDHKSGLHNNNNNPMFRLPDRPSAFELPKLSGGLADLPRPPFPPHPPHLGYPPMSFYLPTSLHPPSMYSCPIPTPEQTEALSLVVNTPKKKRTKVTDTRLSPRAARALLHENGSLGSVFDHERALSSSFGQMGPGCLPTSVAIPNPSLQMNFYKDQGMCGSPGDMDRNTPCSSASPSDTGYGYMKADFYGDNDVFDSHGKQTVSFCSTVADSKNELYT